MSPHASNYTPVLSFCPGRKLNRKLKYEYHGCVLCLSQIAAGLFKWSALSLVHQGFTNYALKTSRSLAPRNRSGAFGISPCAASSGHGDCNSEPFLRRKRLRSAVAASTLRHSSAACGFFSPLRDIRCSITPPLMNLVLRTRARILPTKTISYLVFSLRVWSPRTRNKAQ